MAFTYNGLGTTNPMGGNDFSLGIPAPMAPLNSTGQNTTQAATTAAVAAAPQTPSGAANAATGADAATASAPDVGSPGIFGPDFFKKDGGFSVALGALQTLGNLWNSFQQVKIAKDTLSFQKEAYQTNLANTTKDYNTRLQSDSQAYSAYTGRDQAATDAYVKEHSL